MAGDEWTTLGVKVPWKQKTKAVAVQAERIVVVNLFAVRDVAVFHVRNESFTTLPRVPAPGTSDQFIRNTDVATNN